MLSNQSFGSIAAGHPFISEWGGFSVTESGKFNLPQHIAIDGQGNIYVAVKGNIFVYSPKGEQLEEIKVPNKSAKNLCFGRGEFSKTLFITTSKKLYTIEVNKEGFHIPFKK